MSVCHQYANISFKNACLKIFLVFSLKEIKYMGEISRFVCFLSRNGELRFNLNFFLGWQSVFYQLNSLHDHLFGVFSDKIFLSSWFRL